MSLYLSGDLYLTETGINLNNGVLGWKNQVTPARLSADSQIEGYPVQNLANPLTHFLWASDSLDPQYVTTLLNPQIETDYVGIARHNLGLTPMTIEIEGILNEEDPEWFSLVTPFTVSGGLPILVRFKSRPLTGLRLKLTPSTEAPKIAVLYVGKLTVLERRIYVGHTPLNLGKEVSDSVGLSISGNYLGRIIRSERHNTSVSLSNLHPRWVRDEFEPFKIARVPFFFAWRPLDYPLEIGYCWFPQGHSPRPSNTRTNGMMSVDFEMQGISGASVIVLPVTA